MHLNFVNVNDAFEWLVSGFAGKELPTDYSTSRNGNVMYSPDPIIVTYQNPTQRVLFNPYRDCNPFFHLFEGLWMLAGRNDVAPLAYYNSKIAEIASDDGNTFNGAYGYRWRSIDNMKIDQLNIILDQLSRKPDSRRCVLQMWDYNQDLLRIDTTKDVCCNTHIYFAVRVTNGANYLDMTVCNRSNDMIYGMLGANVVHMSMLQEYMANCLDIKVGIYNQFTNNLHVYLTNWNPALWLSYYSNRTQFSPKKVEYNQYLNPYERLVRNKTTFDREVKAFIDNPNQEFIEPFLQEVAKPMMLAFKSHKERNYDEAIHTMGFVQADDWAVEGRRWINKRREDYQARTNKS